MGFPSTRDVESISWRRTGLEASRPDDDDHAGAIGSNHQRILARGPAVVVEPGAKVKVFKKEDGASMMRFEMAFGKAFAALALGRSSSLVRERAEQRPLFMDYLIDHG